MENCQKLIIEGCFEDLVKETTCDAAFITALTDAQVLGPSDLVNLDSPDLTPVQKSEKLYKILAGAGRPDSFHHLVQSLEVTKQLKALEVLLDSNKIFTNYGIISFEKTIVLRAGSFAGDNIYKGSFVGRDVAVKVVRDDSKGTRLVFKEVELLKKLDSHENIMRYFMAEAREGFIHVALELFQKTLQDEIKHDSVQINAVKVLRECCKGLVYLHSMNVVHTDLNPASILLKKNGQVKISNFGLAVQLPPGVGSLTVYSENVRNMDWMAPEILKHFVEDEADSHLIEISPACDIFSLGCIFFFVLKKGAHPFGNRFLRQSNIYYEKPQLQNCALDIVWLQLIERLIAHHPRNRPSAQNVLMETCFTGHVCMCFSSREMPTSSDHGECVEATTCNTRHLPLASQTSNSADMSPPVSQEISESNCVEARSSTENTIEKFSPVVLQVRSLANITPISPPHVSPETSKSSTSCTENNAKNLSPDLKMENLNLTDCPTPLVSRKLPIAKKKPTKRSLPLDLSVLSHRRWSTRLAKRPKPSSQLQTVGNQDHLVKVEPLDVVDEMGGNNIFSAVLEGKELSELKWIVEQGSDVGKRNADGESILHLAVRHKDPEVIKYFINSGADVNSKDKSGNMPIHKLAAAEHSFGEKLVTLCENGANIHAKDDNGDAILHLAASAGRSKGDIALIISKSGNHWNRKNKHGQTALHMAAKGGNPEVIKYLISLGEDVNLRDLHGRTPLYGIAFTKFDFKGSLNVFLDHEVDINQQSKDGDTLLGWATLIGRPLADISYIVKKGGDWEVRNKDQESVLHLAVQGGNIDAIKYFISLGVSIDSADNMGSYPLHDLIENKKNFNETLDLLLEYYDINFVDEEENTLLDLAALRGREKAFLECIVNKGGDWKAKNKKRQSILHLAAFGGNVDAIKYILALGLGCEIHKEDEEGYVPMHLLAYTKQNFKECLDTFLENGAKINSKNKKGNTLLDTCVKEYRTHGSSPIECEDLEYIVSKGGIGKEKYESLIY